MFRELPALGGWDVPAPGGIVEVNSAESGTEQDGSALPGLPAAAVGLQFHQLGEPCAHSSRGVRLSLWTIQVCVPRCGCASQGHPLPGAVLGSAGGSAHSRDTPNGRRKSRDAGG